jgi:hypothetical protein
MYSTLIYIWIRKRTLSHLGSARRRQANTVRAPMSLLKLLAALLPGGDGGGLRHRLIGHLLAADLKYETNFYKHFLRIRIQHLKTIRHKLKLY